ncbi:DUF2110 family protein [Candidatus Bathyarchaeota archaeon]|nr:DUF2110 family protein [Candidatus Bathyarchaeota archaeon]
MPTVTLPTKVYNNSQLKLVDEKLQSMLKGLKVETKIRGVSSRGLVQITVSGEDEKVALNYLREQIGLCPTFLQNVEKFSTVKGYVASLNKKGLYVDIGIVSPNTVEAAISLKLLQAQLVDGRKMALEKIADLFGFVENLPLTVKICGVDKEKSRVEAVLSEKQLGLYRGWTKSLLDRLIVLGASFNEIVLALKKTGCNRDVVSIERLGLFENAVVSKLGTDAVGLVPKIGRKLRNAYFSIFNPREIIEFLGDYSTL